MAFTFHADLASHEFDKALADGEAESSAAKASRAGAVHLREGLKKL